ncbi:MAG: hypothetical protein ABI355_00420 [Solirubrobacteraceae bacterium]
MLVTAVAFSDFILAIHILAVVIGFGVTFTYPLVLAAARRADPRVMPYLWGTIRRIDRYVVNPGLLVVLLAGIYLAAHEHRFSAFFVQWGFAAVIVIGAAVGSYTIPREGKLAALAAREVATAVSAGSTAGAGGAGTAAAGAGAATPTSESVTWSPEYLKLQKQVSLMGAFLDLIIVVTVFLMATHAGA